MGASRATGQYADSMKTWDYGSESGSHSVVSDSFRPHGLYSPWNSQGQNTGVGSLSLLEGIFPTQELNQGVLHCRQILYQLSCEGSPGDGAQAEISVTPDVDGTHIRIFGSS